jgi:hypothetical protein
MSYTNDCGGKAADHHVTKRSEKAKLEYELILKIQYRHMLRVSPSPTVYGYQPDQFEFNVHRPEFERSHLPFWERTQGVQVFTGFRGMRTNTLVFWSILRIIPIN